MSLYRARSTIVWRERRQKGKQATGGESATVDTAADSSGNERMSLSHHSLGFKGVQNRKTEKM